MKEYFKEIGDEADTVLKEINGPSWAFEIQLSSASSPLGTQPRPAI